MKALNVEQVLTKKGSIRLKLTALIILRLIVHLSLLLVRELDVALFTLT